MIFFPVALLIQNSHICLDVQQIVIRIRTINKSQHVSAYIQSNFKAQNVEPN
jgi:hypothetical protein